MSQTLINDYLFWPTIFIDMLCVVDACAGFPIACAATTTVASPLLASSQRSFLFLAIAPLCCYIDLSIADVVQS